MSLNNYRFSSAIIFIGLLLLLLALFFWAFFNGKKHKKELKELKSDVSAIESEKDILAKIIAIDGKLILEENYESAQKEYQDLLADVSSNELSQKLESRIEKSKKNISIAKEMDANSENTIPQSVLRVKNERINSLEADLEKLKNQYNSKTDSFKSALSSAKASLKQKEKALNRKEKIQVLTFQSIKGTTVNYLGEVSNGKANGGGVGIWTTGSIYRGDWEDNLRHGQGTFEWADGEKYEGEYKKGKRDGEGTYHWPSGERYEGAWEDDRRNGFGKLFDKNGNIRYEGQWKDDKPVDK
ncbi:MAG: hypothetical protein WD048_00090 [Chitinophagales bacterium]